MPHITPFGNRILVQRDKIGKKLGSGLLEAPDTVSERKTQLATVKYVPNVSMADQELLENSEVILKGLTKGARAGDSGAFNSLLEFKEYLLYKSIKPGDRVMIGKHVGIDYSDNSGEDFTLLYLSDVIGVIDE